MSLTLLTQALIISLLLSHAFVNSHWFCHLKNYLNPLLIIINYVFINVCIAYLKPYTDNKFKVQSKPYAFLRYFSMVMNTSLHA